MKVVDRLASIFKHVTGMKVKWIHMPTSLKAEPNARVISLSVNFLTSLA